MVIELSPSCLEHRSQHVYEQCSRGCSREKQGEVILSDAEAIIGAGGIGDLTARRIAERVGYSRAK